MSRLPYEDVDYYDCSQKPNGNYPNPVDCTRLITCHNGRAADVPCADCPPGDARCAGNPYLFYDPTNDVCGWPSELPCLTD